jgi:hypothetical protein
VLPGGFAQGRRNFWGILGAGAPVRRDFVGKKGRKKKTPEKALGSQDCFGKTSLAGRDLA